MEKVMQVEIIIGQEVIKIPYANHRKNPDKRVKIMTSEMSRVHFVFTICKSSGNAAPVVKAAAIKPISSINNVIFS